MRSTKSLGLFTGEDIWFDWEFIDDGFTIDPISVGMVSDRGEYYGVSAQANMTEIEAHPWLSKHVMPHLPLASGSLYANGTGRYLNLDHPAVKPLSTIRDEVKRFVLSHNSPNLWSWYDNYDGVALAQLFGPMVNLPTGFPMHTNDLKTICEYLGDPRVPEQESAAHDALADAKYHREIFKFLCAHEQRVIPDYEWFKDARRAG